MLDTKDIHSVKHYQYSNTPETGILTWDEKIILDQETGKTAPTVLSLNATRKQKSNNRRIQITFIQPPHHGKGRSATSYDEE